MTWQPSVWPNAGALSHAAAQEIYHAAAAAVAARGRFHLALAGGHTPRRLYEILAADYRQRIDWSNIHLYWSDERYVPQDDSSSNYRLARQTLIDPLALPAANVHPMPTSFPNPEDAARAYEQALLQQFGAAGPRFDLALLGIGPEGHTASLFPGSPALGETARWVVPVRVAADPPVRLTLTLPALDGSQEIFFLVAGAEKQAIVAKLLAAKPDESSPYPAARVRPRGRVMLFLDQAALG
ncbi:MAG TPA: 6-phosphogluconolactonase [Candidatus Acidoferrales bacterium]|nr:6-phosphogluconolactonase [Candidatus Acidoferrales bacterium]